MMNIKFDKLAGFIKLVAVLLILVGGGAMLIFGFWAGVINYNRLIESWSFVGGIAFAIGGLIYMIISFIFGK